MVDRGGAKAFGGALALLVAGGVAAATLHDGGAA